MWARLLNGPTIQLLVEFGYIPSMHTIFMLVSYYTPSKTHHMKGG